MAMIQTGRNTGHSIVAWRRGYLALLLLFLMGSCSKPAEFTDFSNPYDELSPNFIPYPDLSTLDVHGITALEAWSGGEFTTDYGKPVTAKGVCWSRQENPTTEDSCTNEGGGLDAFQSRMSELQPDQIYYVRAYASNANGTTYGGQREFTTRGYYPLTVTIDGQGEVSQQVIQPKTTEYVYGTLVQLTAVPNENWVFSAWSGDATGSEEAIVIEVEGEKEITATFITRPNVSTASVSGITITTAQSGGTITDDGGASVTARGVCWSTSQNPTTSDSCTSDGSGTGSFTSSLANLNPDTRYYIRAYATNAVGTAYGNQRDFRTRDGIPQVSTASVSGITPTTAQSGGTITDDGGASVTERGVCWSTSQNPTTSDSCTSDGNGTGSFTSSLANLNPDTRYYIRAYATNAVCTAYGNQRDFRTRDGIPQVSTASVSGITITTAQSGGTITDDGGASVTARGVCWSTSQNPTTSDTCTSDGSGTGSFTSSLANLNPDTRYYLRAYATNAVGTAYGNQRNFTTVGLASGDVLNPATGRVWMDRNLGASRRATSSTDSQAYGDLYQWGRAADGHQRRNSPTTTTLSSSNQPGHGSFILARNSPYDWRSPQNNNLWQGVNGINNPCPNGYRLPTEAEWETERRSWSSNNLAGAFASPLRLPLAGYRNGLSGSLYGVGSRGYYWSGTVDGTYSRFLFFDSSSAVMGSDFRASGFSVRCLKN